MLLGVFALRGNRASPSTGTTALVAALFAIQSASTAVALVTSEPATFWVFVNLAIMGYLFHIVFVLATVLDFVRMHTWVKRTVFGVFFSLASVETVVFWTEKPVFSDYHASAWGNVGVPAPGSFWLALAFAAYYFLIVTILTVLLRARMRSQSAPFRKTTLRMTIILLLSVVCSLAYTWVAWRQWGLPQVSSLFDMAGVGTCFFFLLQYRHLLSDTNLQGSGLLQTVSDPVFLVNAEMQISRVNPRAEQWLGRPEAELVGKAVHRFFTEPEKLLSMWRQTHRQTDHFLGRVRETNCFVTLSVTKNRNGDTLGGSLLIHPLNELEVGVAEYKISSREREVILMLLQGQSSKEIARQLFISEGTVKVHIHNIFDKTGARSRVELFRRFLGTF